MHVKISLKDNKLVHPIRGTIEKSDQCTDPTIPYKM